MAWSFPVGRLFGSEIRIHATFLLFLAWIGISAGLSDGTAAAVESVAFVVALFACVVAHEFGHALMARRFGIHTADVTLLPIGGIARLERIPERPGQEILVALAGPAVNLVIWAVLTALVGGTLPSAGLDGIELGGTSFAQELAGVNLTLMLFNLIPAFPMDGGRVLRAVLSLKFGRVQATRIASYAGQALAISFGLAGLVWGSPILALVAVFIFAAAGSERSDVTLRDVARRYLARDAAITSFEALSPEDTLDAAAQALIRTTQHEFPVLSPEGRLLGFLTRRAIIDALAKDRRSEQVAQVMVTGIPEVQARQPLDGAISVMNKAGAPAVGVVAADGALIGYITPENLGELMVVARPAT